MGVTWEQVVNLRRRIFCRGLGGSVHVCGENVLNNDYRMFWNTGLGCTLEGRYLMLCDVFIERGAI